jgi:FkbH-like protein
VNWRDKPDNMVQIARELNLGLDSFVFFDDNPVERARMRRALPEVLTIEVTDDPTTFAEGLRASGAFERLSYTAEDRGRTHLYRAARERVRLEQSAGSLQEFLGTLQMQVRVCPADEFAFPRMLELIHKTNQFNLTTRRWSAAELSAVMDDAASGVFSLRLVDRFGDQGIVGVAVVRAGGTMAEVDTFLLSCRVIGRQVETAFLRFLADWAAERGAEHLEGEFIETAKNAPARDFYARHGFRQVGQEHGRSRWRLNLDGAALQWPAHIAAA